MSTPTDGDRGREVTRFIGVPTSPSAEAAAGVEVELHVLFLATRLGRADGGQLAV